MLVLSRKKGETILIGNNIEITVLEVDSDTIKIGISAPKEVSILRKELYAQTVNNNVNAAKIDIDKNTLLENMKKLNKKND